eukprot:3650884-Prymnesium_polylepis.1
MVFTSLELRTYSLSVNSWYCYHPDSLSPELRKSSSRSENSSLLRRKAEAKSLNRSAFYIISDTIAHTSSAPATVTATRPTFTSSRSGRLTPTNASRRPTTN